MARPRDMLPRLNIAPPLNAQQPVGGPGMFSPALPTAIQQGFHPPFPIPTAMSMQTPMQPYFPPQPPQAPARPSHHPGQASVAHLAAAGIHPPPPPPPPPNGFPMTPVGGHFARPSLMLAPNQLQPFPHRRRQPSIGGPPKAVLGGPARKLSPIPPGASVSPAPPVKTKKVTVNLPKETMVGGEGGLTTRPSWARTPLDKRVGEQEQRVEPVDLITRDPYPPDELRLPLPAVIDVFLPGKAAWEEMKQQEIEAKLERLGVERGSGSNVPHIFAPHARAASVSSPADPAILLMKLNQLQRSREGSVSGSLSASPQPPMGLSPPPQRLTPGLGLPRHGHTMSLAQPPSYLTPSPRHPSSNPFGHDAILGNDHPQTVSPYLSDGVVSAPDRTPSGSGQQQLLPSVLEGRPDFIRGFGLDIPEEDEEEEDGSYRANKEDSDSGSEDTRDVTQDMDIEEGEDDARTHRSHNSAFGSRHHSRHESRLTAHLSLGSLGGDDLAPSILHRSIDASEINLDTSQVATDDVDAVGEWTGSEDLQLGTETSDDESMGEWSNPSDEEKARRVRRLRRRAMKLSVDKPRRLPNFPRPPESTAVLQPLRREQSVISNPSEENLFLDPQRRFLDVGASEPNFFSPSRSSAVLPHSRGQSDQYSVHDPAQAHSRHPSENYMFSAAAPPRQELSTSKKDTLNPFAKPFVFGSFTSSVQTSTQPSASSSHSRLPSVSGKPLNVAAPEFKPAGFTFRPPPGVPQMPVAPPVFPKSLPPPPRGDNTPFALQGREKRQRRGSVGSLEEGDSMLSFKFPRDSDSPHAIRRSTSYSGSHHLSGSHHFGGSLSRSHSHHANASEKSFSFATFSAVAQLPVVPMDNENAENHIITPEEATLQDENVPPKSEGDSREFTLRSASKTRAPIPIDFKPSTSGSTTHNTVPAGLFKALANEDRTRRAVLSRLSSHDLFEHFRKPSMDDNNIPQISHKRSEQQFASRTKKDKGSVSDDDVFASSNRHARRRSSLPDNLDDGLSSISSGSVAPLDLTSRMETHRLEHILGELLDSKLAELRREISQSTSKPGHAIRPSTEAQIADVMSLFRTQLQESAARSLDDSQMDARGEIDFQLIKDVVAEGQKELLSLVKQELRGTVSASDRGAKGDVSGVTAPAVESMAGQIIEAIREATIELSTQQETISHVVSSRERDAIVDRLVSVLSPMLGSVRPEPVDYEFLTAQLAQAVKPHISQLIDLASDKRETASLIVESLLPLLPSIKGALAIDTDAMILQLVTEVRKAIAPIDAFEIREQVADLVVERLDSRLAVRDKALDVDMFAQKVDGVVAKNVEPLKDMTNQVQNLVQVQVGLSARQEEYEMATKNIAEAIGELPGKLEGQLEGIASTQKSVLEKLGSLNAASEPDQNVLVIKSSLDALAEVQKSIAARNEEAVNMHKDVLDRVLALPTTVTNATAALQNALTDVIKSRNVQAQELEDLRKANADYQVQVAKARSAHGQVRVEKDLISEKLAATEAERDSLRAEVSEFQRIQAARATEVTVLEARNRDLEDALAKALARLQAADVATQSSNDRIVEIEKVNKEIVNEKQSLKTKIESLEMQITFANRDKDTAVHALEALQKQHSELQAQQGHWDYLRQASEKIDFLTNLIGQADNEELQELRRYREQSRVLESEHTNLQKRFKDLESKFVGSERNVATARQTLAQAQQKATDWERRAKEVEGQLEAMQNKLDEAEAAQTKLDADHALVKLQLEEREAVERADKEREAKLREQITTLQSRIKSLETELEKSKRVPQPAPTPTPAAYRSLTTNGYAHMPSTRPDSRASTVYNVRSETPEQSVWDSMHAPRHGTPLRQPQLMNIHAPTGRYPSGLGQGTPKMVRRPISTYSRPAIPSPTPSVVSNAPTLRDDGWYE